MAACKQNSASGGLV